MPYPPMPVLWWSSNEDGSDALSAVPVNKWVWLFGRNIRQSTPFQIHRRHMLTRIPWLGRRLFATWVGSVPTIDLGDGKLRSEVQWQASHVSRGPGWTNYYFGDGNGAVSGQLVVSNMSTAHWNEVRHGGALLNPRLDMGLSEAKSIRARVGRIKRDYNFGFGCGLIAPQDPDVDIEVIGPGTSVPLLQEVARDVLVHELDDLPYENRSEYLEDAMRHIDSFLGSRDVEFSFHSETRLTVIEGEPTLFSLTVRGEGPLRMLFAIQVRDHETRAATVSEFMPVMVTESH